MRTRPLALLLALHAALLLGLYQTGYTPTEWDAVRAVAEQRHISTARAIGVASGPLGYVRYYFHTNSDERLYLEYARLSLYGQVDAEYVAAKQYAARPSAPLPARAWPYRDVRIEYPPLALLGMVPPAVLSTDYATYRALLGAWLAAFYLLNLWLAWRLASVTCNGPLLPSAEDRQAQLRRLGYWSLGFAFCLGNITVTRIDHLVVTFTLLAALSLERGLRETSARRSLGFALLSGVLAGLGVMTKIVPGVAIAAGLLRIWTAPDERTPKQRIALAASLVLGGVVTVLAIHVSCLALFGDKYLDTYRYHAQRGVQIESLYAGVILLAHAFGFPAQLDTSFGSSNVASAATDAVKLLSPVVFLAVSAAVAWQARRARGPAANMLTLTILFLLAFILANRVFSPQYLLWIAPLLLALCALRPEHKSLGVALLLAAALSQGMYPRAYGLLKAFAPVMVLVLNLRNALMVWLGWRLFGVLGNVARARA